MTKIVLGTVVVVGLGGCTVVGKAPADQDTVQVLKDMILQEQQEIFDEEEQMYQMCCHAPVKLYRR